MNNRNEPEINLKKIGLTVLAIYILLVVGYYFLAGEQLLYRNSRGNLSMPTSDAAATELTQDVTVENEVKLGSYAGMPKLPAMCFILNSN